MPPPPPRALCNMDGTNMYNRIKIKEVPFTPFPSITLIRHQDIRTQCPFREDTKNKAGNQKSTTPRERKKLLLKKENRTTFISRFVELCFRSLCKICLGQMKQ